MNGGRLIAGPSPAGMVDWCVSEITGRNPIPAACRASLERISIVILSCSRPHFSFDRWQREPVFRLV